MYILTKNDITIKEFASFNEVMNFAVKQDERLLRIHNKQKSLYKTTAKFVFFNVFAQSFLETGNVVNWFSTFNKTRTNIFHYSLKKLI